MNQDLVNYIKIKLNWKGMTAVHLQSGNSSKCLSRYVLADCERNKSGIQIMRYNNIFVVIYFCQFCSTVRCSTVLLAYIAQQEWIELKSSSSSPPSS